MKKELFFIALWVLILVMQISISTLFRRIDRRELPEFKLPLNSSFYEEEVIPPYEGVYLNWTPEAEQRLYEAYYNK